MESKQKLLLRPKDVKELLGLGLNTVYKLWDDPSFPGYRIGRSLVVAYDDLITWTRRWIFEEPWRWRRSRREYIEELENERPGRKKRS